MSLLSFGLYPREWTVLKYVPAVKLTCGFLDPGFSGFSGSVRGVIVCTDLDPYLYVMGWSWEIDLAALTS